MLMCRVTGEACPRGRPASCRDNDAPPASELLRGTTVGAGQAFLLLETAATTFMAGVLWTMQLLNYPLLALVGRDAFIGYESAHNRRFGLVVIPGVLAAAVGGIGLIASRPGHVPLWAPASELALLAAVIVSTAAVQGRQHAALASGFSEQLHARLVGSNWIRVAAWSAAAGIALWMCHQEFMP